MGELASQNADHYREINALKAELGKERAERQADAEQAEARFRAWAAGVVRAKTQTAERLEEQAAVIADLTTEVAELRDQLAGKSDPGDAGAPKRRVAAEEGPENQTTKKNPDHSKLTNEVIGVAVTSGSTLLTVLGDVFATAVVADAAALIGNLLGVGAAVIALARKRREGRDADRSKG